VLTCHSWIAAVAAAAAAVDAAAAAGDIVHILHVIAPSRRLVVTPDMGLGGRRGGRRGDQAQGGEHRPPSGTPDPSADLTPPGSAPRCPAPGARLATAAATLCSGSLVCGVQDVSVLSCVGLLAGHRSSWWWWVVPQGSSASAGCCCGEGLRGWAATVPGPPRMCEWHGDSWTSAACCTHHY